MTAFPSGTVTFLFSDIQGSTARWDRDRAAMQQALARHDTLLRAAFGAGRGCVFHTAGDAFGVAFASPEDALTAAVAAQRALAAEPWEEVAPGFQPLAVRIGLHTGQAELRDGDYFGPPLNRTARLMAAGHGGQILLSLATQQLVRDSLPAGTKLRDLGVHRLKDLRNSEHIFKLLVDGLPDVATPLDTAEALRPAERAHFDADLLPTACPYRGLFAFREEDAEFFFGREVFTQRLAEAVEQSSLVAVIGPSGSGKSSVVFAGLLPRLRGPGDGGDSTAAWNVIDFRPGNRPFEALAEVLVPLIEGDISATDRLIEIRKMAAALADGTLDLATVMRAVRSRHAPSGRPLLVADQFEELYTLCPDPATRQRFLDMLFVATRNGQGPPVLNLALTLRADFMGHAAAYRPFADALQDHNVILGPMNADELARAITEPAAKQGRAFESGLAERILSDVGHEPGNLPLLEFALTTLWDRQAAGWLTHEAYDQIGRVEGSLARYADEAYAALDPAQQSLARRVFVQLVRPGEGTEDTRRLALRGELGEEAWQLVQRLADARLVVTNQDAAGHETVEVVHEALIRSWDRLREWMDAGRTFRTWQERLRFALRQWEATTHDGGALLRGAPLAEAEGWLKERCDELSQAEHAFIETAVEMRDREARDSQHALEREAGSARELRRRAMLLSGALVVAAVLALAALAFGQKASQSARRAEQAAQISFARELAGAAIGSLEIDAERATLLALEAASATRRGGMASLPEVETALHRALASLHVRRTITDHTGAVVVDWSPDGRWIATASADGTAVIREAASGTPKWRLDGRSDETYYRIAFSPDGTLLARGSVTDTVQLWDVKLGTLVTTLVGHEGAVTYFAFSPNSNLIATSSRDKTVCVWNVRTGQRLWQFEAPADTLLGSLPFDSNGELLALQSVDDASKVNLWDLRRGVPRAVLSDPTSVTPIPRLVVSPDGATVATAGADYHVRLWDSVSGRQLHVLRGHQGQVNSPRFSPDGQLLSTVSSDHTVRIWDVATGEEKRVIQTGRTLWVGILSPDGKQIVTTFSGGGMKLWDVDSGKELLNLVGHTGQVSSPSFSPDGRQLLSGGSDSTARIWDLEPAGDLPPVDEGADVGWLAVSRDGSKFITCGRLAMRVWDASTREVVMEVVGEQPRQGRPEFSPDGKEFVGTLREDPNSAGLWDIRSGRIVTTMVGHASPIVRTAFGPNGDIVATTSEDGTAKLWAVPAGGLIHTLRLSDQPVQSTKVIAEFSPDGQTLATAANSSVIQLWDVSAGQVRRSWQAHSLPVQGIAFPRAATRMVSVGADGLGIVWDLDSGGILTTIVNEGALREVEFSPDGTRLATADQTNQARVWDAATGSALVTLHGHTEPVQDALFSPDGSRIYTASWDDTVRTFILPLDELAAVARSRLTRSLTTAECGRFLHVASCPSPPGMEP